MDSSHHSGFRSTGFIIFALLLPFCFSCRTTYFETPDSLRNLQGTVYLSNGREVEGRLIVNNSRARNKPVKVYSEGDKIPMQFSLEEVNAYRIGSDLFVLKEIHGTAYPGHRSSFLKRLTPGNSRLHLYEGRERSRDPMNKNLSTLRYETSYYLQLPENEKDVWPLNGPRFVPAFDEKMSRIVADCPSLAEKISRRQEGYFYAQVSLLPGKRPEVLLRIIEEYNACASAK